MEECAVDIPVALPSPGTSFFFFFFFFGLAQIRELDCKGNRLLQLSKAPCRDVHCSVA